MIHSDEKVRQMARSLLPAKSRENARWKRARVHRAARSETRRELGAWMRSGDLEEDVPPCAPWEDIEIRQVMYVRRSSDKVNPFIRWATARTRELPREAREGHVRGILPRGVIGEHAWFHLKNTPAFEDPVEAAWWRNRNKLREHKRRKGALLDRGEQAQLLRALLQEPDGHRLFNRFLRERHIWASSPRTATSQPRGGIPPHRPLLGMHDVLPFLDTLKRHPWGSNIRVWGTMDPPAHWVRQFLQRFKAHRGHIPSVRAKLEAEGLLAREVPAHPRKDRAR